MYLYEIQKKQKKKKLTKLRNDKKSWKIMCPSDDDNIINEKILIA